MEERKIVKITAGNGYVGFRTAGRKHRSPHMFYMSALRLSQLDKGGITVNDIRSFAQVYLRSANTAEIRFTWLNQQCCENVAGYVETVCIDYAELKEMVEISLEGGSAQKVLLARAEKAPAPALDFSGAVDELHDVLSVPETRRALSKALRDNFKWYGARSIQFFPDWDKSFAFREVRMDGTYGINGGLILQENTKKSGWRYQVHT